MAFNFIPAYSNNFTKINPDFENRSLFMLSEHFGYDFDELSNELIYYYSEADGNYPKAFTNFLMNAIEGDLMIEPVVE